VSDIKNDVVIAAYLIPDLAKDDFESLVQRVADKELEVEGVALVTVDPDGGVRVEETGDHLGRKGVKLGGGVGPGRRPVLASSPGGHRRRRRGRRSRGEVRQAQGEERAR